MLLLELHSNLEPLFTYSGGWVNPYGKVIPVGKNQIHATVVLDNFEQMGISMDEMRRYGSGWTNNPQEVFSELVFPKMWVRVYVYRKSLNLEGQARAIRAVVPSLLKYGKGDIAEVDADVFVGNDSISRQVNAQIPQQQGEFLRRLDAMSS